MLSTYKKSYEQCADSLIVENWRKMNKNDLVNKYIEIEKDKKLANAYMSAIIVRYWGALNKYYNSSYKVVDKMTCHDWLVQAIMRAIKNRKWKDPTNKLYNDPYAPDKVINRCIISERLIYFQSSNTAKRRQNYGMESIERIQEDFGDSPNLPTYTPEELDEGTISICNIINKAFNEKEYILAFMVDGIINYDTFEKIKNANGKIHSEFSEKKLLRHLRALNGAYCKNFASNFNKPLDEVIKAVENCKQLTRPRLKTAVKYNMKKLYRKYESIIKEY